MAVTHSEYGAQTQSSEVAKAFSGSIAGKTILITGVTPNSLGEGMTEALASQKPHMIILAGRSEEKAKEIRDRIKQLHPETTTRYVPMDLASLQSVREGARHVLDSDIPNIDILINNAGVMHLPTKQLSTDGYELHLATNHLGPFLLTKLLLPKLTSKDGARVVNVASNSHVFQPFRFSDFNFDEKPMPDSELPNKQLCDMFGLPYGLGYLPVMAYGQSKTATILHAVGLNEHYGDQGITAVACHPGAINTNLWRHMPSEVVEATQKMLPMKSVAEGTATPLIAALDPGLQGMKPPYLEDCQQGNAEQVMPYAYDPKLAEKLWTWSEEVTRSE